MSSIAASRLAVLIAIQMLIVVNVHGQDTDQPVILAVTINGLSGDTGALFLQDALGNLYAPQTFLDEWNLRPGAARLFTLDGTEYFQLPGIDEITYVWDHALAELSINAVPDQFLPTSIRLGASDIGKVAPYTAGGHINYDVALTQSDGANNNAAFFDVALFAGESLFTSSHIAGTDGHARLLTTWQRDKLSTIRTLRIGDSYNNSSAWGRGVLFGGIQFGTNFAVNPEFIPFATPSVSGTAVLPATVDIYVDNALRARQNINAGPFTIQNLPVITGAGEMQVVIQDVASPRYSRHLTAS